MSKGIRDTLWAGLESWFAHRGMDPRDLFRLAAFLGLPYSIPDRKLPFREMVRDWLRKPVPDRPVPLLYLGGVVLFLFVVQALTGTLLAVGYSPSPNEAYASVQHVVTNVHLGWLVRQLHAWGANLLILTVFLYLVVAFVREAYSPPGELRWKAGVLLFFLMLSFGFTGRLLPWDNAAYWSTAVGTGVLGRVPLVGGLLLVFLRGELSVGGATLTRFYAFHTIILPWLGALLMAAWFLIVRRVENVPPVQDSMGQEQKGRPFYPDHLFLAGIALYLLTGLLLTLAILTPIPLGDRADILSTPVGIKPPWYFLGAYQFIRYLPASLAVTLLFLVCLGLLLWPFISSFLSRSPRSRKASPLIGLAVLALFFLFTFLGFLSERRLRLGSAEFQFDARAIPHRVR